MLIDTLNQHLINIRSHLISQSTLIYISIDTQSLLNCHFSQQPIVNQLIFADPPSVDPYTWVCWHSTNYQQTWLSVDWNINQVLIKCPLNISQGSIGGVDWHSTVEIITAVLFLIFCQQKHFLELSFLVAKFAMEKVHPLVSEMDKNSEMDLSVIRGMFEQGVSYWVRVCQSVKVSVCLLGSVYIIFNHIVIDELGG